MPTTNTRPVRKEYDPTKMKVIEAYEIEDVTSTGSNILVEIYQYDGGDIRTRIRKKKYTNNGKVIVEDRVNIVNESSITQLSEILAKCADKINELKK